MTRQPTPGLILNSLGPWAGRPQGAGTDSKSPWKTCISVPKPHKVSMRVHPPRGLPVQSLQPPPENCCPGMGLVPQGLPPQVGRAAWRLLSHRATLAGQLQLAGPSGLGAQLPTSSSPPPCPPPPPQPRYPFQDPRGLRSRRTQLANWSHSSGGWKETGDVRKAAPRWSVSRLPVDAGGSIAPAAGVQDRGHGYGFSCLGRHCPIYLLIHSASG